MRDYNIRTAAAAAALYDTSTRCTYSSLEPLVPGAAYLVPGTVHASTRGVSREKLLVSRDYLIARTCYKQSNAFLMRRRRRRSAASPWNVAPLRSTTLRGIRSARSGLGQWSFRSSALHRKSCHASVSVMLEKRGGRVVAQMDRVGLNRSCEE